MGLSYASCSEFGGQRISEIRHRENEDCRTGQRTEFTLGSKLDFTHDSPPVSVWHPHDFPCASMPVFHSTLLCSRPGVCAWSTLLSTKYSRITSLNDPLCGVRGPSKRVPWLTLLWIPCCNSKRTSHHVMSLSYKITDHFANFLGSTEVRVT